MNKNEGELADNVNQVRVKGAVYNTAKEGSRNTEAPDD